MLHACRVREALWRPSASGNQVARWVGPLPCACMCREYVDVGKISGHVSASNGSLDEEHAERKRYRYGYRYPTIDSVINLCSLSSIDVDIDPLARTPTIFLRFSQRHLHLVANSKQPIALPAHDCEIKVLGLSAAILKQTSSSKYGDIPNQLDSSSRGEALSRSPGECMSVPGTWGK